MSENYTPDALTKTHILRLEEVNNKPKGDKAYGPLEKQAIKRLAYQFCITKNDVEASSLEGILKQSAQDLKNVPDAYGIGVFSELHDNLPGIWRTGLSPFQDVRRAGKVIHWFKSSIRENNSRRFIH